MTTKEAIQRLEQLQDAEGIIRECDHVIRGKSDCKLRVRCGDDEIWVRAADLRSLAVDAALVIVAELEDAGYKVPGGRDRR